MRLHLLLCLITYCFFFFNDPATTEIYTLSLHDALPTSRTWASASGATAARRMGRMSGSTRSRDRKSTRLNSSHRCISYAVFCLKKKKKTNKDKNTYKYSEFIDE